MKRTVSKSVEFKLDRINDRLKKDYFGTNTAEYDEIGLFRPLYGEPICFEIADALIAFSSCSLEYWCEDKGVELIRPCMLPDSDHWIFVNILESPAEDVFPLHCCIESGIILHVQARIWSFRDGIEALQLSIRIRMGGGVTSLPIYYIAELLHIRCFP